MMMTAFELVVSTQSEIPWKKARVGLTPQKLSGKNISDEDILEEFNDR